MSDAPEPLPVPRSIRDRVVRTSGGWKVETPFSDYLYVVVALVLGGFVASLAASMCFSLVGHLVGVVLGFGGPAGFVAGVGSAGIAGVMLLGVPLAIAFGLGTSEVLRIDGRGAARSAVNRRFHRPDRIEVRGVPGRKTTIDVGSRTLLTLRHEHARTGWNHEAVTWLVGEMGRIWDVPVDDHRDLDEFEAFDTDPLARARIEWANELAENREGYSGLHALPPQEPDHQADLHGLTMTAYQQRTEKHVVRLTSEHLELRGDRIPLATIDDVRVTFADQQSGGGLAPLWHVTLAIRVGRTPRVVSLASIDEDLERRIGEHHWMCSRIEAAVRDARAAGPQETGDADDVPEALRRLRAGQAGTGEQGGAT